MSNRNPTLQALSQLALQRGIDRLSLVRRPDASRQAGIFVLLLGNKAIAEVGTVIHRQLEGSPITVTGRHMLLLELHQPVYHCFDYLASIHQPFGFGAMELTVLVQSGRGRNGQGQLPALCCAIVGNDLCREMARHLTGIGCPTRLR